MMIVPNLSGDFELNWWVPLTDTGSINMSADLARGVVAAVQLVQQSDPNLDAARVFRATVSGEADWASLTWTLNGAETAERPGADDVAELILDSDTTLVCTLDEGAQPFAVGTLRVYGEGNALTFPAAQRDALDVGSWAFLNDVTFALSAPEDTVPEATPGPRRVRYDYAYEGNYSTTTAHETEFAAGFEGALTHSGGLAEFSGGVVTLTAMNPSTTATDLLFSGDARVSCASSAKGEGFRFGNGTVIFRDSAQASLVPREHTPSHL